MPLVLHEKHTDGYECPGFRLEGDSVDDVRGQQHLSQIMRLG